MTGGVEGEKPREFTLQQASRPDQTQTPPEGGEGTRGVPQPQQASAEGQNEPAGLNVNSANTGDAESPEAGLQDKSPLKRRRSLAFAGPRISDELLRVSENKKP
jgi:hypothetical protein